MDTSDHFGYSISVSECTHPTVNLSKTRVMYQNLTCPDLKEYLDDTNLKSYVGNMSISRIMLSRCYTYFGNILLYGADRYHFVDIA